MWNFVKLKRAFNCFYFSFLMMNFLFRAHCKFDGNSVQDGKGRVSRSLSLGASGSTSSSRAKDSSRSRSSKNRRILVQQFDGNSMQDGKGQVSRSLTLGANGSTSSSRVKDSSRSKSSNSGRILQGAVDGGSDQEAKSSKGSGRTQKEASSCNFLGEVFGILHEVRASEKKGGSRSLSMGGDGSSSRSAEREVAPVQRSVTTNQRATGKDGASSSSRRDGARSDDFKVEMEVEMRLMDGRMATTKYRVGAYTLMRSVIVKVESLLICKPLVYLSFPCPLMRT